MKSKFRSRAFWLRHMRQWHWISAAVCLVGMLLFAITGITLNNAALIESSPRVQTQSQSLPADVLAVTKAAREVAEIPQMLQEWLRTQMGIKVGERTGEWSEQELYISLPRPGGDGWISIDLADGAVSHETTDRGWIAYLNDLHKGRNTGAVWAWFLDVFAIATIVFCLTGLVLMQLMASGRPSTWPLVSMGFIVPALLLILFIH